MFADALVKWIMTRARPLITAGLAATVLAVTAAQTIPHASAESLAGHASNSSLHRQPSDVADRMLERHRDDVEAMRSVRPGYAFWQHIFTIPDGFVAFGSAVDGRLLATFPTRGDWVREADWKLAELRDALDGHRMPRDVDTRREIVSSVLMPLVGPTLSNPTRGHFLAPNAKRYGTFLREWSAIYERFGIPPEIGLAQALVESGFNGTRRSEARAVGFCQWLQRNWKQLDRLAPAVIEVGNQTTQAAYCAAYLAVLGAKYGSLIPALSEHHAGGTNVGRILINGEWLGGEDTREQYFLGADFVRDIREIAPRQYDDLYRTYGPRSYLYAEMVFGNAFNVINLLDSMPQTSIYGMRTRRAIPLREITRATRLSADQVKRFNPALVRRVPANATLYLPKHVPAFGRDVSFWHRPPNEAFTAALADFMDLDESPLDWDEPSFAATLERFQQRFAASQSEEGTVMAAVIAYAASEAATSGRREILAEFRSSSVIRATFEQAVRQRDAALAAQQQ